MPKMAGMESTAKGDVRDLHNQEHENQRRGEKFSALAHEEIAAAIVSRDAQVRGWRTEKQGYARSALALSRFASMCSPV